MLPPLSIKHHLSILQKSYNLQTNIRHILLLLYTHSKFRRMLAREGQAIPHFNLPFWPFTSLLATSFLVCVILILITVADTRTPVLIGLALLGAIAFCYRFAPTQKNLANVKKAGFL